MDQQIFVYVDLDNKPHLVGRLWLHVRKRVESATFRYEEGWLQNPERFALEPALQMDAGPHHTAAGKSLFGAIGDSAPDRWGRALMMRAEARRARNAGEPARTLWEADFLLLVDDETRHGALRFAAQENALAQGRPRRSSAGRTAQERIMSESLTDSISAFVLTLLGVCQEMPIAISCG